MRFKKFLAIVALAVMIFPFGESLVGAHSTVEASSYKVAKSFPKSIRGHWYYYSDHKYYSTKISSKKINSSVLRVYPKHFKMPAADKIKAHDKKKNDVVAHTFTYKGEHWVNVMGYYQSAGDGEYYRVVTHKLGGKKVKMLQSAEGACIWTDGYSFKTKSLAKKYSNHHFKGDRHIG